MTHFAEIDENNIVKRVIVAEQDFINSGALGDPKNWIQTSYNTHEGINSRGEQPLRKNFAGIGYTYDKNLDAFIAPKQYDSWILNEEKCVYEPPIPKPLDDENIWKWNEQHKKWDKIDIPNNDIV